VYTLHVNEGGWRERLSALWFALKTLGVRGRFFTGKASFVDAEARATEGGSAEIIDASGRRTGRRALSHCRLATRPPLTGAQGWRLFARRARGSGASPAALECGYCKHLFFVALPRPADSYACEWFGFPGRGYRGEATLLCPRCEQRSLPRVERPA
jgi:hypothetical protein